jgi:hypothetical protein
MTDEQFEYDRTLSGYSKRASKRDKELAEDIKQLDKNDPDYWSQRHHLEADHRVTNDIDFFCHDGDETKLQNRTFTFVTATNRAALEAKSNSSLTLTRLRALEKQIGQIHKFAKYSFSLLVFIALMIAANYYGWTRY